MSTTSDLILALQHHALAFPEHSAIETLLGEKISYGALQTEIDRLSAAFSPFRGQAIAINIDHCLSWLLADLAALKCGVVTVPLPPFFTTEQKQNALLKSRCVAVLTDQTPSVHVAGKQRVAIGTIKLNMVMLDANTVSSPLHLGTAKVTFTSGSTAAPKGVCLSAPQMCSVAKSIAGIRKSFGWERHLVTLPLPVLLENVAGVYATLMAGHTIVVPDAYSNFTTVLQGPDYDRICQAISTSGAHSIIAVPEMLRGLLNAQSIMKADHSKLQFVAVGGSRVSEALLDQARAQGWPVYQGYGLSEAGSVTTLNLPGQSGAGSVGQALPHAEIEIGSDREIYLKQPGFLGYCGEPSIDPDLFPTGDLGHIDHEGFVYIDGRKKNVLITSEGRNICPEWPESLLLSQPCILQAFAFETGTADIGALVVIRADARDAEITAAIAQSNSQLPPYAQINFWRKVPAFTPQNRMLTGNGRLRRQAIRDAHLTQTPAPKPKREVVACN